MDTKNKNIDSTTAKGAKEHLKRIVDTSTEALEHPSEENMRLYKAAVIDTIEFEETHGIDYEEIGDFLFRQEEKHQRGFLARLFNFSGSSPAPARPALAPAFALLAVIVIGAAIFLTNLAGTVSSPSDPTATPDNGLTQQALIDTAVAETMSVLQNGATQTQGFIATATEAAINTAVVQTVMGLQAPEKSPEPAILTATEAAIRTAVAETVAAIQTTTATPEAPMLTTENAIQTEVVATLTASR